MISRNKGIISILLLLWLITCLNSCSIHYYGLPYYEDLRGSYCSDVIYVESPVIVRKDNHFFVCDSSRLSSVVYSDTINKISFVYPLLSEDKIVPVDFASPFHPYTAINYLRSRIFKKSWQVVFENIQYLDDRYFNFEIGMGPSSIYSFKEIPKAFLLLLVPSDRKGTWIGDVCIDVKTKEYVMALLPIYTRKQRLKLDLLMSDVQDH